jgi:hypothetical protein
MSGIKVPQIKKPAPAQGFRKENGQIEVLKPEPPIVNLRVIFPFPGLDHVLVGAIEKMTMSFSATYQNKPALDWIEIHEKKVRIKTLAKITLPRYSYAIKGIANSEFELSVLKKSINSLQFYTVTDRSVFEDPHRRIPTVVDMGSRPHIMVYRKSTVATGSWVLHSAGVVQNFVYTLNQNPENKSVFFTIDLDVLDLRMLDKFAEEVSFRVDQI